MAAKTRFLDMHGSLSVKDRVESGGMRSSKVTPDVRTSLRKELAAVLGEPAEPNARELRATFTEGVSLVKDLERSGQIDPETAKALSETLATLYLNSILIRFSADLLGTRLTTPSPAWAKWILNALKK